jgi:hypothetical protein
VHQLWIRSDRAQWGRAAQKSTTDHALPPKPRYRSINTACELRMIVASLGIRMERENAMSAKIQNVHDFETKPLKSREGRSAPRLR